MIQKLPIVNKKLCFTTTFLKSGGNHSYEHNGFIIECEEAYSNNFCFSVYLLIDDI